jgi:ribosome-binding protein aMBF1 (putative translation factor)
MTADVLPFPSGARRHDGDADAAPADDAPDPRLREVVGDVLREERHRQGRTLADVAKAASVSLPYLSEIERGRKEVSSDVLGAVAAALELRLLDVLERSVQRLRPRAQGGSGVQLMAA